MTITETTEDRIEAALTNHEADNPDYPGLTVKELTIFLAKGETTVRGSLKKLVAAGRVTKEGSTYKMTTDPDEAPEKTKARSQSQILVERDQAAFEALQSNPKGLSVEDLAKALEAEDFDDDQGWSPSTYMSLRRLRHAGKVERVIAWRVID